MISKKRTAGMLIATTLLIIVTYMLQAADSNAPFKLQFTNQCTSPVRILYSYKTAGIPDFEKIIQAGETVHLDIEPQDMHNTIRFFNREAGSDVQLFLTNLLQDRQGSNLLAISVSDTNYDPYAPNKDLVNIVWQR